jgi:hypothetical protein
MVRDNVSYSQIVGGCRALSLIEAGHHVFHKLGLKLYQSDPQASMQR